MNNDILKNMTIGVKTKTGNLRPVTVNLQFERKFRPSAVVQRGEEF